MRLIDADALLKKALDEAFFDSAAEDTFCEFVETAPTVYAVEVVRCKDCRYLGFYRAAFGLNKYHSICEMIDRPVCYDDFCSFGERREP